MKLVLWPSGAGGDFLLGLALLMSKKTSKITYNKKTFQFEAPKEFCVRYEYVVDNYEDLQQNPDAPGLDDTVMYMSHHLEDDIDYETYLSDCSDIVHIRTTDWRTLSYINCLYYTKVITYDRITGDNGPPEDQHFDYRLAYWENTKIDKENVTEINYEKIFFEGSKEEVQKFLDVCELDGVDVDRFISMCKKYTDVNFHQLVERPYLDEETTRYETWVTLDSDHGSGETLDLLEEILDEGGSYHRVSLDIREQWKLAEDWDGDVETHK